MGRVLVMSIRPHFAERIFKGEKHAELRRVRPQVDAGDIVIVYASSPTKALVGAFVISGVCSMATSNMWTGHANELGVTREEYASYFAGADVAHALLLAERVRFGDVPLEDMRQRLGLFRPPQSYMFWTEGLDRLLPPAALTKVRRLRRQLDLLD